MDDRELKWAGAMRAERVGDVATYEHFLREFSTSLRRIVAVHLRRLGLNATETEDVVQEVLIAVHSRRRHWDTARPLIPWLNAITRYKMIDAARRMRREVRIRVELTTDEWSNMDSGPRDPDLSGADLEKLVLGLPAGQQRAVRAVAIEGASHREAAERLGMAEGTVRVAFHRGLKTLMASASKFTG